MAKGIFSFRNNLTRPIFTKTVKRNTFWLAGVLVGSYILFNLFTLIEVGYLFNEDLDARIGHELEHIKHSFTYNNGEVTYLNPNEFLESDLTELTENPFFLQVYDMSGKNILISANIEKWGNKIPKVIPENFNGYIFNDMEVGGYAMRFGYGKLFENKFEHVGYIQLSTPKTSHNTITNKMILFNLSTFPIALIIFFLISAFLVKQSLAPINRIIDLADEISATNLSKRITYDSEKTDELGKLKSTLNNLFDRLERQIDQIEHFSDNASHQLMTPITAINAELDYILKKDYTAEEYRETLVVLNEQTKQMIRIVKSMLIMAKDCEQCVDTKSVFNLSKLINDEIFLLYPSNFLVFDVKDEIYLRGRSDYFSLVVQNIIENAIKFSQPNPEIELQAVAEGDSAIITVRDNGIGIREEEKSKIFDRFYRGKDTELRGIKGHGLGLALVKSIVEKMSGQINVENNQPTGTIISIKLPIIILE
ncbi:MAG: HAMP domain-containing sensor histidine kinase [Bacteroidota bacterium]